MKWPKLEASSAIINSAAEGRRAPGNLTFIAKVQDYLTEYLPKMKRASTHTVAAARSSLSILIRYLRTHKQIDVLNLKIADFKAVLVSDWLNYEEDAHQISAGTRNRHLAAVKSYIAYLCDHEVSAYSVLTDLSSIPYLKVPEREKAVMTQEEVLQLLRAAKATRKGQRNSTMLLLLYETAIRVSELTSLTYGSVMLSGTAPHILVSGKGKKSRRINLTAELCEALRRYCIAEHADKDRQRPLFYTNLKGSTQPLSSRMVEKILKQCADAARQACPSMPQVHPHMLRRTKATSLYQNGTPIELVSVLLGHSQVETTMIYAKPSDAQMRQAMEANKFPNDDQESVGISSDEMDELLHSIGLTP